MSYVFLLCLHVEAIKNNLLQWFHEKNRKIEDGYNYEVNLFESIPVSI